MKHTDYLLPEMRRALDDVLVGCAELLCYALLFAVSVVTWVGNKLTGGGR